MNPQIYHADLTSQPKTCNCRNSKCVKLYCQCFANKQYCNKNCHCVECLNHDKNQLLNFYKYNTNDKKGHLFKNNEDLIKSHKGCACKKSGCMKKYCECFQAGIVCSETCKCIDCQNTDSSTNRKVIRDLKKNDNAENPNPLYTILLSQNQEHYNSIIDQNLDKPGSVDINILKSQASLFYDILNENQSQEQVEKQMIKEQKIEIEVMQADNGLECKNEKIKDVKMEEQHLKPTKKQKIIDLFINILKQMHESNSKIEVQI